MDTVLDRLRTTEDFLAWEDRQAFKHEFDGRYAVPMTGGSVAHQRIVINLCVALMGLLADGPYRVCQEMRLRVGRWVRYPDVLVCAGPVDQRVRTLSDAIAIFEVLSEDTAVTDRVQKLIEYSDVPSLRAYVLLEQSGVGATLLQRDAGGPWVATAHTDGAITLPGLDVALPLSALYAGLTFSAAPESA